MSGDSPILVDRASLGDADYLVQIIRPSSKAAKRYSLSLRVEVISLFTDEVERAFFYGEEHQPAQNFNNMYSLVNDLLQEAHEAGQNGVLWTFREVFIDDF